jgi:tetratricopeptide (TPR) repeat protein
MLAPCSPRIDGPLRDLVDSSQYREAVSLFLEWSETAPEVTPRSRLLAAQAASRIGEFELADTLATQAQAEFQVLDDKDCLLDCTNVLGAVAFERGSVDQAEAQFQSVMVLAERIGSARFIARAANNLASVAHLRGQRERATALYRRALDAYRKLDDQRGMIEIAYNLAQSLRESGRLKAALEDCTRAVDAAERVGAGGLRALTRLGRAEMLIESGEFDSASLDIEQAQQLAWLEGNEPHTLESERLKALLALRCGHWGHAYQHAEIIRTRASHSGCALIAAESAAIAALALKADRRPVEAAAANDVAIASLVALGANGRLESHARHWRNVAA